LRQLEFLLGAEQFRNGLRLYLADHAYGNAEWSDLVHALEKASGTSLTAWADAWIQHRGVPVVTTEWSCADARISSLTLHQRDAIPEDRTWPIATEVLLGYADAPPVKMRVEFNQASYSVGKAVGKVCPDYVFANDEDHAYGVFLPDEKSRASILENVRYEKDVFTRTMMWGTLFDSMHFAELNPRDYMEAVLSELPSEQDEWLVRSITGRAVNTLHYYLPNSNNLTASFEALAFQRMKNAATQGQRIIWFRSFVAAAQTPDAMEEIKNLLRGRERVPDVEFRALDRWRMVTVLLAYSDKDALEFFTAERDRDQSGIGKKYAYVAVAARPAISNKSFYFDDYLHNQERPEDWVQDSLASFNQWNQADMTIQYLRPALDALPHIKQQRKIFFLMAWLNAFIGGQHSNEASHEVYDWLATKKPEPDLRLKVLQVLDELDRTVEIRSKFH
jgi:aminopeptidase N